MLADTIMKRITELREQKGVSEREMSIELGKSPNYLYFMRKNKSNPSLPMLNSICQYLGITLPDFFHFDNHAPAVIEEIKQGLINLPPEELLHMKAYIDYLNQKEGGAGHGYR